MKRIHPIALMLICAISTTLLALPVSAANLRYTFTGHGSGSLDAFGFENSAFAIVGEADPVNSAACGVDNCRYLDFASVAVHIEGVGDFAVLSTLRVFNTVGNLGLSRGGPIGTDLYNVFQVPQDYDFSVALGPVFGLASLLQWNLENVETSGGVLVFENGDTDGSFKAEGVPLPASAWLLGSALLLGAARRRRAM